MSALIILFFGDDEEEEESLPGEDWMHEDEDIEKRLY